MKNIGIVGLGLIGASLAKSAKKKGGFRIYGFDLDRSVTEYAILSGIIDNELKDDTIEECEVIILSIYPEATVNWLRENRNLIKKGTLVLDCGGVKRTICNEAFDIAKECGFDFIGGHPMAGTQQSGIKNSKDTLFHNACFVLVPKPSEDVYVLSKARELVISLGFSRVSIMSAERHDELIAFTSQLAHVVSNAYVKSPAALSHKGISAGSFRDLTRVAYLNENMWTELFLANSDNLTKEIDILIDNLKAYRDALEKKDENTLRDLLREGREAKEESEKCNV